MNNNPIDENYRLEDLKTAPPEQVGADKLEPAERPKNDDVSIYHRPGMTIQAKDGTEYVVGGNGAWLRTTPKSRSKKERAKEKREAKRLAEIAGLTPEDASDAISAAIDSSSSPVVSG